MWRPSMLASFLDSRLGLLNGTLSEKHRGKSNAPNFVNLRLYDCLDYDISSAARPVVPGRSSINNFLRKLRARLCHPQIWSQSCWAHGACCRWWCVDRRHRERSQRRAQGGSDWCWHGADPRKLHARQQLQSLFQAGVSALPERLTAKIIDFRTSAKKPGRGLTSRPGHVLGYLSVQSSA